MTVSKLLAPDLVSDVDTRSHSGGIKKRAFDFDRTLPICIYNRSATVKVFCIRLNAVRPGISRFSKSMLDVMEAIPSL